MSIWAKPLFLLESNKYYYRKRSNIMSEVILRKDDVRCLAEVSQWMVDYKVNALKSSNWKKFQKEFIPKLERMLITCSADVRNPSQNIFTWLADQLRNSLYVHSPKRPRIAATELGERAILICDCAAQGQRKYEQYRNHLQMKKFFTED